MRFVFSAGKTDLSNQKALTIAKSKGENGNEGNREKFHGGQIEQKQNNFQILILWDKEWGFMRNSLVKALVESIERCWGIRTIVLESHCKGIAV